MSEVKYKLNYRIDGKPKTVTIKVDWISNYCTREYRDMMAVVDDIKKSYSELQLLMAERGNTLLNGKKRVSGWKDEMAKLDEKYTTIEESIRAFDEKDYFQRRFDLVHQILKDNAIKQDYLYDFDFWDMRVNPTDMMEFLSAVIYKDLNQGTKQGGAKKK
jgi:hypothetical protein